MNKTKIIGTIGPASKDKRIIKKMIINGMDVVRLNLAHANYKFCQEVIETIQKLNSELDTSVAVMIDIDGPAIRTHKFKDGSVFLKEKSKVKIYSKEIEGTEKEFSVNYNRLIEDVKYHTEIKLADGKITLKVIDKELDYLVCEVIDGGILKDNQTVIIKSLRLNQNYLSDKDKENIEFASKSSVDFIALSQVRTPEDILEVNDLLINLKNDHIGIISKIENENALDEIDEIIRVSDGIIVARGDLGVELPLERVPSITKMIINKCHITGKISIVATEMLSSMENDLTPTRAEVSDVANAVMDGVDAVMLSGETTIGKYPVQTVEMMDKIIGASEKDIDHYSLLDKAMRTETEDVTGSLAYSATQCADRLKCKAIVTPTYSGYTSRKISRFRPNCPIIAICPSKEEVRSLALNYGVYAYYAKDLDSFDKIMDRAKKIVSKKVPMGAFDKYIVTGGYPFKEVKHTNFMKIEEI